MDLNLASDTSERSKPKPLTQPLSDPGPSLLIEKTSISHGLGLNCEALSMVPGV